MTELLIEHIVLDSSGKARIRARNVAVKVIAEMYNADRSIDEIAEYLDVTPVQVHAVLAYYYDHKADMDAAIQVGQALADATLSIESLKQHVEAHNSPPHRSEL